MRNLFAPIKNAELNKPYFSNVVLSGIGTGVPISLISGSASLTKNGAALNDGIISNGDTLGINTTSSAAFGTTTFVVVRIGLEDVILSVTTHQDPAKYNFAGFAGLTPLELTKYQSGQDYIPNPIDNALSVYKTDGTLLSSIPAKAPATNGVTSNDVIVVADYYSRNILKIDTVTKAVISAIDVGNRPYGVAHTPTSDTDASSLTWVSVYGDNKVVVLDKNNNVVDTHYTGEKPMGIAVTQDGKHLFVANNAAGTVTHFQLNGSTWTSQDVVVGAKPFEVATDLRGNAWVTCTGTNKVYRITRDNVVTAFVIGDGPRGVILDGSGNVWVALANENAIAKLNPTNSVITKVATHQVPFALALGKDGAIYVSNFGDSTVQKIVNGAVVSTTAVNRWPYGIAIDNSNQLWAANLYSNTPEYLYAYDQTPLGFGIADQTNVRPSTLVTSNTITIAEVNTATPVSVPNLYGATIIKNGTSVGTTTTAVNGDSIAFSFTAPAVYDTQIDFPIFVGLQSESFKAYILPEDRTPDAFTFTERRGDPNTTYTSNAITVTGIDSTATITANASAGATIIKNGTDTGVTSVAVGLGDTIALKAKSSSSYEDTLYYNITIGGVTGVWRLTTVGLTNLLWIKPEYKNTSIYEPTFNGLDANNCKLTRIAVSDLSMQSWSMRPHGTLVDGAPKRFVVRPIDGDVIGIDYTNDVASVVAAPTSFGVNVYPVHVHANRFVSCHLGKTSGVVGAVYDIQTQRILELPAHARQSALVGSSLYVTMANGSIAIIDVGTWTLSGYMPVAENLQAITVDGQGSIWVSDLNTDKVYRITNGSIVATVSAGADIRTLAANATHVWAGSAYDNTVAKINLSTLVVDKTFVSGSVPNSITFDKNGRAWIGHFASSDVLIVDANTTEILNHVTLSAGTAIALDSDGDYVWVHETYIGSNSVKVSPLTPFAATFNDVVDVKLNATARSNTAIVSGLIRPTKISLQPGEGRLYVDGTSVTSAIVDNGTALALEIDAGSTYYLDRYAYITSSSATASFHIRTEADIYADNVLFTPQFDAYIRQTVASDTVGITGISPNTPITLRPSEESWSIVLNGVVQNAGVTVSAMLNDTVSLRGPAKGQYGTTQSYGLIQVYPDATEATLGTFVVTNKSLDGPVPSASKAARSGKNEWQRDLGYSYQSIANAGYLNNNYRAYVAQYGADGFVKDVSKLTVAEVDRVFDSLGSGHLQAVPMPSVMRLATTTSTQAIPYERLANTTQTSPAMQYDRLSNTHHFSQPNEFVRSAVFGQNTMSVQYIATTRHNYYLGDELAVVELDAIQFPYRYSFASPTPSWDTNARYSVRTVSAEWERNTRFTRLSFMPTWDRNTRFKQLAIDASYVKHASEGLKSSPIAVFEKATNVYRNVEAQYVYLPRKTLRDVEPPPLIFSTRRLTIGLPFDYVRNVRPMGSGADFDYVRNVRKVISVQYAQFVPLKRKVTPPEVEAQYMMQTRHIAPSAEAQFTRQVRHVSPSALSQYTQLRRSVITSSVNAAYETARRSQASRHSPEAVQYGVNRGAYVLLEERQAFARYVRHDYTVNEDAATEGAYATAAEAIAAGVAAGYPRAYAVALPRGHFMWATPMPRDPAKPPLYPIPEKWYVHGG